MRHRGDANAHGNNRLLQYDHCNSYDCISIEKEVIKAMISYFTFNLVRITRDECLSILCNIKEVEEDKLAKVMTK